VTAPSTTPASRTASAWLPFLLLLILGVSWGVHFPVLRFAAETGLPHSGIAAAIITGVALSLTAICAIRGRLPPFGARQIQFYGVCAVLGYVIPYLLALFAAGRIDSGMLTLIGALSPVMTLGLAALLRIERVTVLRLFGIALGLASVVVLAAPQAEALGTSGLLAMAVALGVPASYSSYHIFVLKRWPGGLDSFQLACGEAVVAICMLLPLYGLTGDAGLLSDGWTAGHWAMLFLVLLVTMDCYLYFEIVRLAGPVYVSQANFITIVAGVLWGMALHGERPSPWVWLSAALLLGCLIALARQRVRPIVSRT
jgi:drug/metabolite transporter (DMT)-like permease